MERPYGATAFDSAAVITVLPAPVAISCMHWGFSKNLLNKDLPIVYSPDKEFYLKYANLNKKIIEST